MDYFVYILIAGGLIISVVANMILALSIPKEKRMTKCLICIIVSTILLFSCSIYLGVKKLISYSSTTTFDKNNKIEYICDYSSPQNPIERL